jgi:glycosyltransferase involved in cell wall biosynthesis
LFLSVCIITKNEESNIKSCLDSIKEIADEIIILDSFSTDNTISIAKEYTSKIYTKKWIDDYSFSRNFTISKAKGEWILIIDADEKFTYEPNFISKLKATKTTAFSIIRKEIYRQHHDLKLVKYPVTIIRLFKRETNATFQYPIHERLDDYFYKEGIPVALNQNCYLEHNISLQIEHVNSKQNKYLELIDRYLKKHPNDEWLTYQKIKTLKYFKKNEQVLDIAKIFKASNIKINIATNIIVAQLYIESGKLDEATKVIRSLPKSKNNTIATMLLGDIYFKQKKYRLALKYYIKLKTSSKSINFKQAMYIVSYCEKEDKIYKIASVLYALKLYFLCILFLDLNKKYLQADSLLLYALIFLKKDNKKQALEFIQKARNKDPYWKKLINLENLHN